MVHRRYPGMGVDLRDVWTLAIEPTRRTHASKHERLLQPRTLVTTTRSPGIGGRAKANTEPGTDAPRPAGRHRAKVTDSTGLIT